MSADLWETSDMCFIHKFKNRCTVIHFIYFYCFSFHSEILRARGSAVHKIPLYKLEKDTPSLKTFITICQKKCPNKNSDLWCLQYEWLSSDMLLLCTEQPAQLRWSYLGDISLSFKILLYVKWGYYYCMITDVKYPCLENAISS